MRYYLLAMILLPLLEMFDRWKARHTQQLDYGGAFNVTPRFGWAEGEFKNVYVSVFFFNVPLVRQWKGICGNFRLEPKYGWCKLLLMHTNCRPASAASAKLGWHDEWQLIEP